VCSSFRGASDDEFDVETPQLEAGFSNVIFVHNLPVVPPEKFEKLVSVVRKIYSQIGVIPEGAPRTQPQPFSQRTRSRCACTKP
jgi:translation initiation factor 3 subunit B